MSSSTDELTTADSGAAALVAAVVAPSPFTVAVTADAARPDGSSIHGDLGLRRLSENGIS